MFIRVVLSKDEFQPALLELISKALNRDIPPHQVVSLMFEYTNQVADVMKADIDFSIPEPEAEEEGE
jgi:hypothetical protein